MAAFVAVADEVGLPQGVGPYPKFSVGLSLAQRRWKSNKGSILRLALRTALGGAAAMALVANLQLIPAAIMTPEDFRQNLELTSLPMWIFSNVLLGLLWGGLLGGGVGFSTALADAMWKGKAQGRWRWIFGSFAGLIHSFFLILLSLFEGFKPVADASIFVPVYLLYGMLTGGALSLVVPKPGAVSSPRVQLMRSMKASGLIALIALPAVYLVYREGMASAIVLHLLVALFFPLGLALALIGVREDTGTVEKSIKMRE